MRDPTTTPIAFAQWLKDRLPLESLVAAYVPSLSKRGASWKGLCPFHKEKTPSFYVHPEKGFFHCFGCGKHGDAITFVQEAEKVDFMGALELLARRAGVAMPAFGPVDREREADDLRRQRVLHDVCAWAAQYFVEQLRAHPRGAAALDYLRHRGLTEEEIARYGLGYAPPEYDRLIEAARRKGWAPETLAEAGLAARRESGGFLDRFRDRVMFPIEDQAGQVVAFAGRVLEPRDDAPKYINSPETPIFRKSRLLYGLARARNAIARTGEAILLEGYMDWLALHRRGIEHVLAGMGTALTDDQARLIKRFAPRVVLLYDGDEAGQKAMLRAAELLLLQGLEVRAAVLPPEHDPDSLLAAQGTQPLRDILSQAPPVVDYVSEALARTVDFQRPESKAEAVGRLAPLLLAIQDPVVREGYCRKAAGRLGLRLETLESALARRRGGKSAPPREADDEPAGGGVWSARSRTEQYLLYLVMQQEDCWAQWVELDPEWFSDEVIRSLVEAFRETARDVREGADPPTDWFEVCRSELERQALSAILLLPAHRFGGEVATAWERAEEALALQRLKLQRAHRRRLKMELQRDLELIAADKPLGEGHLAHIDRLARAQLLDQMEFLARHAPDGAADPP